jgi:hypothetical protein
MMQHSKSSGDSSNQDIFLWRLLELFEALSDPRLCDVSEEEEDDDDEDELVLSTSIICKTRERDEKGRKGEREMGC